MPTITYLPQFKMLVTANADGVIPLNSRVVAEDIPLALGTWVETLAREHGEMVTALANARTFIDISHPDGWAAYTMIGALLARIDKGDT